MTFSQYSCHAGPGHPLAGRAASRKALDSGARPGVPLSGLRRNDETRDNYETVTISRHQRHGFILKGSPAVTR